MMPLYRPSALICVEASWVWRTSLTRSMGATTVFEIPPETPPISRSRPNVSNTSSVFLPADVGFGATTSGAVVVDISDDAFAAAIVVEIVVVVRVRSEIQLPLLP